MAFFESFKEFVWDIIGFLLPGSYCLIILSVCVDEQYFVNPSLGPNGEDYSLYVFAAISYLVGHIGYGIGQCKEKLLFKRPYTEKIEFKVAKQETFVFAKQLILKLMNAHGIVENTNELSVRELRNFAMSFVPDQDRKIYTYRFRSDLSNQSANISIIIGLLGISLWIFDVGLFKSGNVHLIIYFCLICSYWLFNQTRDRFYEISIALPFSIFTANQLKNEH